MASNQEGKTGIGSRLFPKAPTGICGLDEILEGGLPRGRITLIGGGPGSGKTLLGLEFLYRGALKGEAGIFIGFEEPLADIRTNAAGLGWEIEKLENNNMLFLLNGRIEPGTLVSGDFSLKGLLSVVEGKARQMGAQRIVVDAIEVILRLVGDPLKARMEIFELTEWIRVNGLAGVMTIKPRGNEFSGTLETFFESLSDCVIRMDARVVDQISTRRLRVIKYRGSGFGRNEYPYVITGSGLHTAPISTVGLRHKPLGEKMSTGLAALDTILLGGVRRGSCLLIAGLPGTGKTIMASTITDAACLRHEKVLYVGFEESEAAMVENLKSAGIVLSEYLDSGLLEFLTAMPEAMGAEEHLIRFMQRLEAFEPDHVIVDAISACERMGGLQAAFEYLMRLLNNCKEKGVTVVMVNQTRGSIDHLEISGNGISSMIDTVVFMNYKEEENETKRVLQVLKSRGSGHSNRKHPYVITDQGIQIQVGG